MKPVFWAWLLYFIVLGAVFTFFVFYINELV